MPKEIIFEASSTYVFSCLLVNYCSITMMQEEQNVETDQTNSLVPGMFTPINFVASSLYSFVL